MALTRRQFLAASAAAPSAMSRASATPPGSLPPICLYSQVMAEIEYADIGPILRGMGFDGCDLSVQPGGHVEPKMASLDLTRAVESLRGAGVDVPVITTALTSARSAEASEILALAGIIRVGLFRPGHLKYGMGDAGSRLSEARREMLMLGSLGRQLGLSMALHNGESDDVGANIHDIDVMLRSMDPEMAGYDFDIGNVVAFAGPEAWAGPLELALPRTKMVTVSDRIWRKTASGIERYACPLGEGMVDIAKFCAALGKANFQGPVSLQVAYKPGDPASAIQRDLSYLKKRLSEAYQRQ